eukprot:2761881-Pyramimonas_sp.AAC.1
MASETLDSGTCCKMRVACQRDIPCLINSLRSEGETRRREWELPRSSTKMCAGDIDHPIRNRDSHTADIGPLHWCQVLRTFKRAHIEHQACCK